MTPRGREETGKMNVRTLLEEMHVKGANRFTRLFDFREAAEECVNIAQSKHPKRKEAIEQVLLSASYPGVLLDFDRSLYEKHIDELVTRAIAGESLAKPTRAERCVFLCQLSLKSPLKHDYVEAYQREMAEIYPAKFQFVSRGPRDDKELNDVILDIDRAIFSTLDRNKKVR